MVKTHHPQKKRKLAENLTQEKGGEGKLRGESGKHEERKKKRGHHPPKGRRTHPGETQKKRKRARGREKGKKNVNIGKGELRRKGPTKKGEDQSVSQKR